MFRNIEFCLEQLRKNIFQFIFRCIQITISLSFIIIVSNYIVSYQQMTNQIDYLSSDGEVYYLKNNSYISSSKFDDEQYNESFNKLIYAIENSGIEQVVCINSYLTHIGRKSVSLISVSSNFFERYNIKGDFSKDDIEKYFVESKLTIDEWNKKEKYAIVGYSYSKQYDVGDTIEGLRCSYKIIGFLDENAYYSAPSQGHEIIALDDAIIVNVNVDNTYNYSMQDRVFYTQFIVQSQEDLLKLQEINNLNISMGLLDTYVQSYSLQMKNVRNSINEIIVLEGFLGVSLLIFSLISFVFVIIQLMEENEYEYAINMLCGAKKSDIYLRVIFEPVITILLATFIAHFFIKYEKVYFVLGFIDAFCITFLMIYGFIRLNKTSIYEKLRRNK